MVDYSLLFFASQKRLNKMLQIDGREHIDKAIADDKNIIILLAHSVMLEFGPAAIGFQYDCFGSYKTSKSPVMDWMIAKSRCRHVSFVVSREEGLRKLIKSLAHKKLMIFLPDEDLGLENSTFAPFFNKQKATLTTTARIAKMGKAKALPAFTWFDPVINKYRLQILPALDNYPSKDATLDAGNMNQSLEVLIKQHPSQYIWTMKLYRTRPESSGKDDEAGVY
jgi:lauroyl/myristoyl acyltransferase